MNVDRLLAWPFRDVVQTYTVRDTMLYALGVGFGGDPVDAEQLRYVYEKDLRTVPSMAVVLGHPGPYVLDPALEIDFRKIVVGGQAMELHRPLPVAATIRARERVTAILDKGSDKGVVLCTERRIVDDATDEPLATLSVTLMCRGDGGCGASHGSVGPTYSLPGGDPHRSTEIATLPQGALLYRLNGDTNPIHVDPEVAKRVGFERPILHGLCSYGLAVNALLKLWCDYDSTRIVSVSTRFSAPVFPGETIVFETWRDGSTLSFRAWSKERQVKVLDNGCALLR